MSLQSSFYPIHFAEKIGLTFIGKLWGRIMNGKSETSIEYSIKTSISSNPNTNPEHKIPNSDSSTIQFKFIDFKHSENQSFKINIKIG